MSCRVAVSFKISLKIENKNHRYKEGEELKTKVGSTIKNFMKVFVLSIGFLFSLNAFSAGDLIHCGSLNNLKGYNTLHELIKNDSDSALVYSLAITSLCLGKEAEGMSHLQKASDSGHISATKVLGDYYEHSRTFNSAEYTDNLENLNHAIHYYTKAAQLIEALSNYPKGATDDMEYIESETYSSYDVFTDLPGLYWTGYAFAIESITEGNERISYADTLEVLNNLRITAIQCLERPSLSVWKGKREIIYQAQQIECEAYLRFAEAVFPLEQQRIQVSLNCVAHPSKCSEHQELIDKIDQLIDTMFYRINSAPQVY